MSPDIYIPIISTSPACNIESQLGEGPLWCADSNTLSWVDILGHTINRLNSIDGQTNSWNFQEPVCAISRTTQSNLLVAMAKRIVIVDEAGVIIEEVCKVETNLPDNRVNDGKADPAGRFWFGTMHLKGKAGEGSLYRLDASGKLERIFEGLSIANGLAWSSDSKTMFYIDSPTREIWAFDFDPDDSAIKNRRTAVRIPDYMGVPDGMTIDSSDNLWVAHWGDGTVRCWSPTNGRHLMSITVSDSFTTSCAFGGKNMQTLFISTATDQDNPSNSSGRLFSTNLKVSGTGSYKFKM